MQYSTHLIRHLRFTIGRNINKQRLKQQMSLRKLVQLSGISEYLLDQYELGKNEIHLDKILKISFALEVEIEKLIVA
jgi:transcriptional regulator with XRE-family HTH domain